MFYTLEKLREENTYNAARIKAEHVEAINGYIKAIEQSRKQSPQPFDDVDFTTEYGQHTEHATIDGESMASAYKTTVCEHGIPHPVVRDDGKIAAVIGCGGVFYPYDPAKMEYIGTAEKRCQIITGDFIEGYFSIYFRVTVSRFRYDERKIDKSEATAK